MIPRVGRMKFTCQPVAQTNRPVFSHRRVFVVAVHARSWHRIVERENRSRNRSGGNLRFERYGMAERAAKMKISRKWVDEFFFRAAWRPSVTMLTFNGRLHIFPSVLYKLQMQWKLERSTDLQRCNKLSVFTISVLKKSEKGQFLATLPGDTLSKADHRWWWKEEKRASGEIELPRPQ